jgi:hypothetical protein
LQKNIHERRPTQKGALFGFFASLALSQNFRIGAGSCKSANPIAKEIKPEARIAQIDQMCAGSETAITEAGGFGTGLAGAMAAPWLTVQQASARLRGGG